MPSRMTVAEANEFLAQAFTNIEDRGQVTEMEEGRTVASMDIDQSHLRPGNYISGPTQMALADMVAYMVVMSRLGPQPMAVTSSLNINFLRPCLGHRLVAEGRMMKLGRTLAIIEVDVRAAENPQPSSHAVVTYALPRP